MELEKVLDEAEVMGKNLGTWVNGVHYLGPITRFEIGKNSVTIFRETTEKNDGKSGWQNGGKDVIELPNTTECTEDPFGRIHFATATIRKPKGRGLATLYPKGMDPKQAIPVSKTA